MKVKELLQYLKDGMEIGYPPEHIINDAIQELEKFEAYEIKLSSLTNENNSLVKTLMKMNEEIIKLREENQGLK